MRTVWYRRWRGAGRRRSEAHSPRSLQQSPWQPAGASLEKSVQAAIKTQVRHVQSGPPPKGPDGRQAHSPWQGKEPPWALSSPRGSSQPQKVPTAAPTAHEPESAVLSAGRQPRQRTTRPRLQNPQSCLRSGQRFWGRTQTRGPWSSRDDASRSGCWAGGRSPLRCIAELQALEASQGARWEEPACRGRGRRDTG